MSSTGDNTKTTADSGHIANTPSDLNNQSADNSKPPNPQASSKVSGSRKKSWVWDHFIKIDCEIPSDQKANCKYCGKELACPSVNGTSCLNNHLSRCKKYPYNVDKRQKVLSFQPIQNVGEGTTTHALGSWKFDQDECRKFLARMVIVDELPFRHVELEGFRDFCSIMQPRFIVPSRHTVARDCYKIYKEEKIKLKIFLKKLPSRVCLTTDAWTSTQNLSYMCLTAHFIDNDWKLHKKILNFCPISSHSGEVIGKAIEGCLLDWGIDKVFTVTVDNASSNDVGIQYLKKRVNSWKGSVLKGEYLHILILTVKEGLVELDDSTVKIHSTVKYVRSSPSRLQKFKNCVEKELIQSKSLVCLDVETRWNSTYLMLESALKFQKAFELMESVDSKYVEDLTRKGGVPNESDWDYARNLLPFLKIFYETTLKLSGSLYVTGNEYMKEVYGIGMIISSRCKSGDLGVSLMASKMKRKHDKYWANVNNVNIMLFIAVVLDPRCKLEYVNWIIDESYDDDNAGFMKKKVREILNSLFEFYSASQSQCCEQSSSQSQDSSVMEVDLVDNASDFLNSMYKMKKVVEGGSENKNELDKYLGEECENGSEKSFNILVWWKLNSSKYRVLSLMARDVLSMPVSTVASESAFSTGGRVLNSFRSSLTPRMVEALICGQDWLRRSHVPLNLEENLEELEKMESSKVA